MEKLYTRINRPNYPFKINYNDSIIFLGSCFSDNIGIRFEDRKFNVLRNPFGTIFNPYSTFWVLEKIIKKEYLDEKDWFFLNEKWRNLQLHSDCSFSRLDEVKNLNNVINYSNEFIKKANYIFLTLGTSWIYVDNKTQKYVGNCHKIPQNNFTKKILSIDEITQKGEVVLLELLKINKNIKIIFTVSPIRYLSFGAFENSISKSHLFSSINNLLYKFDNTFYFPSYELFLDEMRDYRFYSNDLLHPNDLGLNCLWEFICNTLVDSETLKDIFEIERILKFKNHRVLNHNSEVYKKSFEEFFMIENKIKQKYNFMEF